MSSGRDLLQDVGGSIFRPGTAVEVRKAPWVDKDRPLVIPIRHVHCEQNGARHLWRAVILQQVIVFHQWLLDNT